MTPEPTKKVTHDDIKAKIFELSAATNIPAYPGTLTGPSGWVPPNIVEICNLIERDIDANPTTDSQRSILLRMKTHIETKRLINAIVDAAEEKRYR